MQGGKILGTSQGTEKSKGKEESAEAAGKLKRLNHGRQIENAKRRTEKTKTTEIGGGPNRHTSKKKEVEGEEFLILNQRRQGGRAAPRRTGSDGAKKKRRVRCQGGRKLFAQTDTRGGLY